MLLSDHVFPNILVTKAIKIVTEMFVREGNGAEPEADDRGLKIQLRNTILDAEPELQLAQGGTQPSARNEPSLSSFEERSVISRVELGIGCLCVVGVWLGIQNNGSAVSPGHTHRVPFKGQNNPALRHQSINQNGRLVFKPQRLTGQRLGPK